jgi:hypothetical protein
MITYRFACCGGAVVCLVLFAVFLVAPAAYLAGYGVVADTSGQFLGNRTAPLFLGLAAMCWLLRDQTDHQVRWAVSLVMMITFWGIAITGVWDYAIGQASSTILIAAVGETILAGVFLYAMRTAP